MRSDPVLDPPSALSQQARAVLAAGDVAAAQPLGEEWLLLARATAACTGAKTADLLTERDLEEIAAAPRLPWDDAVDGPLPDPDGDDA